MLSLRIDITLSESNCSEILFLIIVAGSALNSIINHI